MRNTESVANAAVEGRTFKASALSTAPGVIMSYKLIIGERTGPNSWKVLPAGGMSQTTTKHCNGIANELAKRGCSVTRS